VEFRASETPAVIAALRQLLSIAKHLSLPVRVETSGGMWQNRREISLIFSREKK
jgi:hypothetical protein